ncbi:hypothetical protein BKM31_14575 [[Actinomadura] parvosata subsp. kistnae]|uniref:Uncharacterized protein n=1 Tax=[Actinomadura] parvosata subsp. kistnae TaxID=1909395 RepID=A0A1U9ZX42_9ACTN|nr:hypothetical protein BKM31_14575 [Nonomuraea sp. ATCC 55076]
MRFSADSCRAVEEMTRIGRSTRPATSQPSTAARAVTTMSARAAWGSSADRVSACTRSAKTCRSSAGVGIGGSVPDGSEPLRSRRVKKVPRRISR